MFKHVWLFVLFLLVVLTGAGMAGDMELQKELEALKRRVQELEIKLKAKEANLEAQVQVPTDAAGATVRGGELKAVEQSIEDRGPAVETPVTGKASAGGVPVRGEELKSIKETFMDRLGTLSIHGGALLYYQGRNGPKIEGIDYKEAHGAGLAADLEFAFQPLRNGEFFMRIHAGEGQGADKDLVDDGALFANLNTIADDNPDGDGLSLLEAFYTHTFCDERYFVSIGKTEQVVFIDDNAFANDEYTQFVGKPFVNNPMFDSEDEFAPLVAAGMSPVEWLNLILLFQSTSRPRLEEELQKSKYDDMFDTPFLAGQITYSPELNGLPGNYRLFAWGATYQQPEISGDGADRGWGIGLSLDQMVTGKVGLFARLGYSNDKVYEAPWFWSVGTSLLGLISAREEDSIGIGVAGLKANNDLEHDGTEYHLEAYYRLVLSEHFAISPDVQYVINPLGNSGNDNVIAGMIRGQFAF
jgi:hypothetical protein